MKKSKVIIMLLLILILSVGCTEKEITKDDIEMVKNDLLVMTIVEQNNERYDYEQAIDNGEVVSVFTEYYNEDVLIEFIDNYSNGISDSIRCVGHTIEGDAIVTDLVFKDNQIFYRRDTSRDKYGPSFIEEGIFDKLVVQKDKRNGHKYNDVYLYTEDKKQIVIAESYRLD